MTGDNSAGIPNRSRGAFSRLGLLVLIALCLLFVSSYTSRLMRKAQLDREISQLEESIAAAELRQARLLEERDYVHSPAYVEKVARDELDMAREGDTVIIVLSDPPPTEAEIAAVDPLPGDSDTQPQLQVEPTWRQWIDLLSGEE